MQEKFDAELKELKPFPISDEELLDRYEKVFTAACVDVMDMEFDLHHQVLPTYLHPIKDGQKVAGFAFPIKGVSSPIAEEQDEYNLRMAKFIGSFPKDFITVWDVSGDDNLAQYGEMMSYSTMSQGCRAAIVDGGVRDVDRIIDMGFKVWAKVRTPRSMWHRHRIIAWAVPIQIQDVLINYGDVVFADMDGIVVIPREIAYEVLLRIEERQKTELGWRGILASGLTPVQAFEQGVEF